MKQLFIVTFVAAIALVACGGSSKKTTTTNNNATEMKTDGSATGGSTYGTTPADPCAGTPADPCAGQ